MEEAVNDDATESVTFKICTGDHMCNWVFLIPSMEK